MKIFLGPAGLPMASEGKTVDGVKKVKELGLDAMEIEFVRSVYMNEKTAEEVGQVAKENNVRLSVHAPYYINLCSKDDNIIESSKDRILKSLEIGEILRADAVATHAAYYSGLSPEEAYKKLRIAVIEILDQMESKRIENTKLGFEVMGKKSQFGSLDEMIKLCKDVGNKQFVPYLDWGHILVRNGSINYDEVFEKLKTLKLEHINSHFEGVGKNKKGEFVDVHTPMGNHPPFEPLAREIVKRKLDITIISESPILEVDSLKMKQIFENLQV